MLISVISTITSAVIHRQRHCGSNVNVRCRGQQGRGFSSLPPPIKGHEALKNDVENGGVKNVSGKCCIIVQSAITFVVILGWHTPQDVPIPSIHNAIAAAMSNALPRATRSWILQTASAYKTA